MKLAQNLDILNRIVDNDIRSEVKLQTLEAFINNGNSLLPGLVLHANKLVLDSYFDEAKRQGFSLEEIADENQIPAKIAGYFVSGNYTAYQLSNDSNSKVSKEKYLETLLEQTHLFALRSYLKFHSTSSEYALKKGVFDAILTRIATADPSGEKQSGFFDDLLPRIPKGLISNEFHDLVAALNKLNIQQLKEGHKEYNAYNFSAKLPEPQQSNWVRLTALGNSIGALGNSVSQSLTKAVNGAPAPTGPDNNLADELSKIGL